MDSTSVHFGTDLKAGPGACPNPRAGCGYGRAGGRVAGCAKEGGSGFARASKCRRCPKS